MKHLKEKKKKRKSKRGINKETFFENRKRVKGLENRVKNR